MAKTRNTDTLVQRCAERLTNDWQLVVGGTTSDPTSVPVEIAEAIRRSIGSKTKSYRYVLPTQLLAKAVEPTLDAHALQAGAGSGGAFDARSFAAKIIVPFDRENDRVLGGSPDPYVNNPLRVPAFGPTEMSAQKDKAGFADLLAVLDWAQAHPHGVGDALIVVLRAIRARQAFVTIDYPVPNRVSLDSSISLLRTYLDERSGGVRLQALVEAIMKCVGERLGLFATVRAAPVNASDTSTGRIADLECVARNGMVVLAVEAKDRSLTLRDLQDKLPAVRAAGLGEFLFMIQGGAATEDAASIQGEIDRQFAAGHNVYVCELFDLTRSVLVLVGEDGRRRLLKLVGEALDSQRADLSHRQAWSGLLRGA